MKNVWDVFDQQYTKKVPIKELKVILRALDIILDKDELKAVEKVVDPKGEGIVSFNNLKLVMEDKLKDSDTVEDLLEQFNHLDKDMDGKISTPEFRQYMQNLGKKMKKEELDELMKAADGKNEG